MSLLILLGIGSFAYNQYLVNKIRTKEKASVQLWARAMEFTSDPLQEKISQQLISVSNYLDRNDSVPDSIASIIDQAEADRTSQTFVTQQILLTKDRFRVPRIIVDENDEIVFANYVNQPQNKGLVETYAAMNDSIPIKIGNEQYSRMQYVYYGESPTVRYLRYFPYIQLGLLGLLLSIAFVSYRTITKSEQSNLWVGMTKEAAHQLGTPLSSLYGWVELLREKKKDDDFTQRVCNELENDVSRLRGVADRFNKIGSEPELKRQKVSPILESVLDYMEQRLPKFGKNVEVHQELDKELQAEVNSDLFEWAIENIIKNAMDAIKSSATGTYVSVKLFRVEDEIHIDIKDTGSGIDKKYQSQIFDPGYSTKKRGWGLGLSLTKRIIEEYHSGKLVLRDSEVGRGTTIGVVLKTTIDQDPKN